MIQISYWAKENKFAARCLIAVIQILLFVLAAYIGITLHKAGLIIDKLVAVFSVSILALAIILYPGKRKSGSNRNANYVFRKALDLVVIWTTLICICFISNDNNRLSEISVYAELKGSFVAKTEKKKEVSSEAKMGSKKYLRKQLKELLKEVRKSKGVSAGKVALIFLLILLGCGLTILLAGLSCSLACNGSDALALVVLILGITGIIFLMLFLIRAIEHAKEKAKIPNAISG